MLFDELHSAADTRLRRQDLDTILRDAYAMRHQPLVRPKTPTWTSRRSGRIRKLVAVLTRARGRSTLHVAFREPISTTNATTHPMRLSRAGARNGDATRTVS